MSWFFSILFIWFDGHQDQLIFSQQSGIEMVENQKFDPLDFPKFLHGFGLKTALTMFPYYAEKEVKIVVPYLIESEILTGLWSSNTT